MVSYRLLLSLYLAALFFIGLGYLAILPPFEGFDESAHYSSIMQIADTGTLPVYGHSFIDQSVIRYREQGPFAYGSMEPPFDKDIISYARFFGQPDLVERYKTFYRQPQPHQDFMASSEPNWQAQHPPLYYALLAPIARMTDSLSTVSQIFVLRLASYILAIGGVLLAALAVRQDKSALTGFLIYPLVLPMFFPEFTRIGNDSLCLLLAGAAAFFFSRWLADKNDLKYVILISVTLGLGLLTKAFFVPMALVFFVFAMAQPALQNRLRTGLVFLLPALLIGGGWYLYKYLVFGAVTGSNDSIQLAQQGGLAANLQQHFSLFAFMRALAVTFVSWSWAGTWSLARLPFLLQIPMLILLVGLLVTYAQQLKNYPKNTTQWLPFYLLLLFACGFLYHIFVALALNGNGGTPGWYLHILMPWVAPAFGLAVIDLEKHRRVRKLLAGLLVYAAVFQVVAVGMQVSLFAGCATKGDNKLYQFPDHTYCLTEAPRIFANLSVVAFPMLALCALAIGLICIAALMVLRRHYVISTITGT